jgi:hypothetical protein
MVLRLGDENEPDKPDPKWLQLLSQWAPWAAHDLREMIDAPRAVIVVLLVGGLLGWLVHSKAYEREKSLLEQRVELAESLAASNQQVQAKPTPESTAVTYLLPGVSASVGIVVALLLFGILGVAIRNSFTVRRLRRDVAARDGLLDAAVRVRDDLASERDKAIVETKDTKYAYAMRTLDRYANLPWKVKPRVTVRCIDYGEDHELAERIKGMFEQYVRWPVTIDPKNDPPLKKAKDFKVCFDVGQTVFTYGDLVHAFSDGDLLGVTVGKYEFREREDGDTHLIVEVLPSAGTQRVDQ